MPSRPAVLVVDDDDSMRLTLSLILEEEGCQVLTAASGEDAVRVVRGTTIDVALVDMKMPGMSGEEVCVALTDLAPAAALIVITAHVTPDAARRALASGAHAILYKPLDLDALLGRIRELTEAAAPCA